MLYTIINMSDPYTIEASTLEVAFVACTILGNGQFAFMPVEEGGIEIPMFMFGGIEEFCLKNFTKNADKIFGDVIEEKIALADCFDSCLISTPDTRRIYNEEMALITDADERYMRKLKWHNSRRSSTNDIGGRAWAMAKKLRDGHVALKPAPKQVFIKQG